MWHLTRGKSKEFASFVLVLVLLAAACAPTASPTPTVSSAPEGAPGLAPTGAARVVATPPRPATVKYGSIGSVSEGGTYLAIEKGYFKEQGITVEVANFRSGADLIAPLAAEQVDLAVMPITSALVAAADRGVDLRIVAAGGQSRPQWEDTWLVLRKDLADSGQVKTAADLKGMKVTVPSPGSVGEQTIQMFLQHGGLKPGDVEVVFFPFPEQAAAFRNKAIAAAFSIEPFIATGSQAGFAVKWIPVSQFFGGKAQLANIVFGPALLKDQDLARRWMIAYLKGVRDYLKAASGKEGREGLVNSLVKYTPIKEPKLFDDMEMSYVDPNGQPDRKSINAMFKWFVEKGLYTGKKTFEDMIDLSYAEYAVQKLGK